MKLKAALYATLCVSPVLIAGATIYFLGIAGFVICMGTLAVGIIAAGWYGFYRTFLE